MTKKDYLIETVFKSSCQKDALKRVLNEYKTIVTSSAKNPEVINKIFEDMIEEIIKKSSKIFDKYFSEEELQELITFYRSVAGQKAVGAELYEDVLSMTKETMKEFEERILSELES